MGADPGSRWIGLPIAVDRSPLRGGSRSPFPIAFGETPIYRPRPKPVAAIAAASALRWASVAEAGPIPGADFHFFFLILFHSIYTPSSIHTPTLIILFHFISQNHLSSKMNPNDSNNSGENQFTGQGGGFRNLLAGDNLFGLGTQSSQFGMDSSQIPSQGGLPYFHGPQYAGFPQGGYVGFGRPTNTSSSGDDVYRPTMSSSAFGTPGTDESTVPLRDLNFSTDEYEVSDMEPSPPRAKAAAKGKRKEKVAAKSSEGGQGGRTRSTYSIEESMALARCWADISEDPIVANNQGEGGFWGRITQRYEQVKPDGAPTHKPGDLRKHWKRIVFECAKFHGIYDGHLREMRSGESELSVRELSLKEFRATVNSKGFKFWDTYQRLKDFPKFKTGMSEALQTRSVRTRLTLSGSYSSGGAEPIDLSEDQPPIEPPPQRPMGVKAAKAKARKGKGKTESSGTDGQSAPVQPDNALGHAAFAQSMVGLYNMHMKSNSRSVKKSIWNTIQGLKKKMGLDEDDEPEPDD